MNAILEPRALVHKSMSEHTQDHINQADVQTLITTANRHKYTYCTRHSPTVLLSVTYSIVRPIFITPAGSSYVLMTHCKSGHDTHLGSGSSKTAKIAINLETGELATVAISKVKNPNGIRDYHWRTETLPSLKSECLMMEKCAHVGAVKLIGSCAVRTPSEEKHYMLMEYCEEKSLQEKIKTKKLSPTHKCALAIELTRYISGLHALNLVNCDIKPANIFMKLDGSCRIGDFGMCKPSSTILAHGTPLYIAPELAHSWHHVAIKNRSKIYRESNTQPSDAWALGCVLYELFHPEGTLFTKKIDKITSLAYIKDLQDETITHLLTQLPDDYPKAIKEVISGLLKVNPAERMTAEAAHTLLSSPETTEFLIQHPPRQRKRRCWCPSFC